VSRSPTLVVGYVARPHGTSGELAVRTFDPGSEALAGVERLRLRSADGAESEYRLVSVRPGPKGPLLSLDSVETRTAAEALQGATVLVYRTDLPPPAEGEYFQGDLVGLRAVSPSGEALGRVEEVWNTRALHNLVSRAARGDLVVPVADDFAPTDHVDGGVVVRPPEMLES